MLTRRIYDFPLPEIDGVEAVEIKYLELSRRHRNGEFLENEEIDYMDFANNILLSQ